MKKYYFIYLIFLLFLVITGCSTNKQNNQAISDTININRGKYGLNRMPEIFKVCRSVKDREDIFFATTKGHDAFMYTFYNKYYKLIFQIIEIGSGSESMYQIETAVYNNGVRIDTKKENGVGSVSKSKIKTTVKDCREVTSDKWYELTSLANKRK